MAKLSDAQMVILRQVIDDGITARRRGGAKSARPEFKAVYDKEIAELQLIKPVLEALNAEGKATR